MINMNKRPKLLGVAASLRNARWGIGNKALIESLEKIETEEELHKFLEKESELHLENFIEAGRKEGRSFLEINENLKKNRGSKGLSNSEVALASALWAALRYEVDIEHVSLSEYFLASGAIRNEDVLKEKLLAADGLLISGPVYFGDRGSMVQSLVDMIRRDKKLSEKLRGKLYGGISVGAKRNGGQETTLVYQMYDFASLGYWVVGNDSDTTAQYGGTGYAGDIGTMHKDSYGLRTAMGTGRRIASLMRELNQNREIKGPTKVLFVILQDRAGEAEKRLAKMLSMHETEIIATVINISEQKIYPCIACDICPTHIDYDEIYRCIITSKQDSLQEIHSQLLHHDAIIPVMLSTIEANDVTSSYQTFMERTRYLRRGDYAFSNQMVAPIVFEEIGASQNYALRAMTSMIRHHTVIGQPMIGYIHSGELLNDADMDRQLARFIEATRRMAAARLAEVYDDKNTQYNPVGYVLAANKEAEDVKLGARKDMVISRYDRTLKEAQERLLP